MSEMTLANYIWTTPPKQNSRSTPTHYPFFGIFVCIFWGGIEPSEAARALRRMSYPSKSNARQRLLGHSRTGGRPLLGHSSNWRPFVRTGIISSGAFPFECAGPGRRAGAGKRCEKLAHTATRVFATSFLGTRLRHFSRTLGVGRISEVQ